jgi:hypothetical protein
MTIATSPSHPTTLRSRSECFLETTTSVTSAPATNSQTRRGCRRLTRLPPVGHAAFQSVAARRHSPATHQEGHQGRHGGSPPRTPAAPVSTLRTLPTHPSLAIPTLRTETTGRLRLGRLVLGVASRHTPPGLHEVLQEPCASCHRTGARRHYSVPIHPDGRQHGWRCPYRAASGGTDEHAGQGDGGRRWSGGFRRSVSYPNQCGSLSDPDAFRRSSPSLEDRWRPFRASTALGPSQSGLARRAAARSVPVRNNGAVTPAVAHRPNVATTSGGVGCGSWCSTATAGSVTGAVDRRSASIMSSRWPVVELGSIRSTSSLAAVRNSRRGGGVRRRAA